MNKSILLTTVIVVGCIAAIAWGETLKGKKPIKMKDTPPYKGSDNKEKVEQYYNETISGCDLLDTFIAKYVPEDERQPLYSQVAIARTSALMYKNTGLVQFLLHARKTNKAVGDHFRPEVKNPV